MTLDDAMLRLRGAILRARLIHPTSDLTALVSEVAELGYELKNGSAARIRAEAIDVAVVAIRIALGETK